MPPYTAAEICNFFYNQSVTIWKRIEFARSYRLRISETTVTENILFDFHIALKESGLPVKIFEARKEDVNGNDLEIFLKTASGYVLIPCQAKILNPRNKYAKVFHKVGDDYQVDLLWAYAARFGGIPGYLFYNFMPKYEQRPEFRALSDQSQYGISFMTAHKFKYALDYKKVFGGRLEVPTFNELHPHDAYPFHQLVCEILAGVGTFPRTSGPETAPEIKFYAEDEIGDEDKWRRMSGPAAIGLIRQEDLEKSGRAQTDLKGGIGFNPKYRLVIGLPNDQAEGGLYSIS